MKKIDKIILFLIKFNKRYKEHHITAFAGQMAYFFTLSIFPMLMFTVTLISKLNINYENWIWTFKDVVPEDIAKIIYEFIDRSINTQGITLLSVSGIIMLYSASRATHSLQRALNSSLEIADGKNFLITKLYSMLYTLLFIVIMILSLIIPEIIVKALLFIENNFLIGMNLEFIKTIGLGRHFLMVLLYLLVFGSIYMYLPSKRMKFKETYKGAIFAIVGTALANSIFTKIVTKLIDYSIIYGSLSAIIALMIWLYIFSIIILLGAELNAILNGR